MKGMNISSNRQNQDSLRNFENICKYVENYRLTFDTDCNSFNNTPFILKRVHQFGTHNGHLNSGGRRL